MKANIVANAVAPCAVHGAGLRISIFTAHNRSVYASPPVGGSGYEKPQSAYGLCAVFLRHIFAVAGTLRVPLSQPQKRHIQPERYAQFFENSVRIYKKIYT
jgi:hypothetical protein